MEVTESALCPLSTSQSCFCRRHHLAHSVTVPRIPLFVGLQSGQKKHEKYSKHCSCMKGQHRQRDQHPVLRRGGHFKWCVQDSPV